MRQRKRIVWMAMIALIVQLMPVSPRFTARAQSISRSFSADQVRSDAKGTKTRKVHGTEKAMRLEDESGEAWSIDITRFDRKVIWGLNPNGKTYYEMSNWGVVEHFGREAWFITISDENSFVQLMSGFGVGVGELARAMGKENRVQRESLGTEQVGPYQCEKSRISVVYKDRVFSSLEWASKELDGFVVKRQGEKGDWSTEYQNVQLGSQDPSLFEVPSDYTKDKKLAGFMYLPKKK